MHDFSGRHTFNFPTSIRFGAGVIDELPGHLLAQGLSRPLVVTDETVQQLPFFKKILDNLVQAGLTPHVFSEMQKNPVKSDVLKGGDAFEAGKCDCIAGIGGGVAMDVARAIALRIHHRIDLFEYDDLIGGDRFVTGPVPYFVTAPTTSGTGSEVGRSAIISEDETKRKRILFHPKLMAKMVFADPELTYDLPPFITAATGMDALTHNMEAFLAKNFHPMAEGIALEGIRLIRHNIVNATNHPDAASRAAMMLASLMGAVAFQKGLGVVHSLAHPLSSLLDTHHGLANAVNLPYGMEFNLPAVKEKFQRMATALDLPADRPEKVPGYLLELNQQLGLPVKLKDIGVKEEHLGTLATLASEDFCHPNNPRPVTREDFLALYRTAF